MTFELDENTVKQMISERIDSLVTNNFDALMTKMVEERMNELARRFSDTKQDAYDSMKRTVEFVVRDEVRKRIDELELFTPEKLQKMADDMAGSIAFKLQQYVTSAIARALTPPEDDEDDDES